MSLFFKDVTIFANLNIFFYKKAKEEFDDLDKHVQEKFTALFQLFEENPTLPQTKFKQLKSTLFYEFRIKTEGCIYRAIGGKTKAKFIIVVVFKKKSQKTPIKELKTALNRFNKIYE